MPKNKLKMSILLFIVGFLITVIPVGTVACGRRPQWKLTAGAYVLPITPETTEEGIPINPDGSPVYLAGFGDPVKDPLLQFMMIFMLGA